MCASLAVSGSLSDERLAESAASRLTKLYEIDPTEDTRWSDMVERHPLGSLFHSTAWLKALQQTYGYRPIAFTTSTPLEPLRDGFLFCQIKSWITGCRLVSVPFSDYCDILCPQDGAARFCADRLMDMSRERRWRYIELRPIVFDEQIRRFTEPWATYTLHRIDLQPNLGGIFANFHPSSIQRKIKRAERESLGYEEGSNNDLLDSFYRLLVITRRRHRVPPQPKVWFHNLIANFGGDLKIRIASYRGRAVAGIITIRHKDSMYYKYGGSEAGFNRFGSIHSLYWQAIQDAKRLGLRTFDLGRSDMDQPGLITFKSRWGATMSTLKYYRIASSGNALHCFEPATAWRKRVAGSIFSRTPSRILSAAGAALYKHIG